LKKEGETSRDHALSKARTGKCPRTWLSALSPALHLNLTLLCKLMGRLAVSAFQKQQLWINLPSMLKRFVKYD
jgi:hypothetical protein